MEINKKQGIKLDLKLYRGYVNDEELVVSGHVFQSWAPDKYRLDRKGIHHAVAILHMFRIKPYPNVEVTLRFQDHTVTTKTLDDGFFRFTIPFNHLLESGWHPYEVSCKILDFDPPQCLPVRHGNDLLHERSRRASQRARTPNTRLNSPGNSNAVSSCHHNHHGATRVTGYTSANSTDSAASRAVRAGVSG